MIYSKFISRLIINFCRKLSVSLYLYIYIFIYFCGQIAGDWDQAVDVGCGSGQFTTGLSSHFKQVIGIDYSESQISESTKDNKHDNVTFK